MTDEELEDVLKEGRLAEANDCPANANCGGCVHCDPAPDGYGMTRGNVGQENQLDPPCPDCIGQDKCPYCDCGCNLVKVIPHVSAPVHVHTEEELNHFGYDLDED